MSKNQALQILFLKHHAMHAYSYVNLHGYEIHENLIPTKLTYNTVLTLTQQLTHLITGQPS